MNLDSSILNQANLTGATIVLAIAFLIALGVRVGRARRGTICVRCKAGIIPQRQAGSKFLCFVVDKIRPLAGIYVNKALIIISTLYIPVRPFAG